MIDKPQKSLVSSPIMQKQSEAQFCPQQSYGSGGELRLTPSFLQSHPNVCPYKLRCLCLNAGNRFNCIALCTLTPYPVPNSCHHPSGQGPMSPEPPGYGAPNGSLVGRASRETMDEMGCGSCTCLKTLAGERGGGDACQGCSLWEDFSLQSHCLALSRSIHALSCMVVKGGRWGQKQLGR